MKQIDKKISKINLTSNSRTELNAMLSQSLSDGIDLHYQVKQAHWNVKGENFIALHELFDAVATEVSAAVDTIAERIMQLGGSAQGTVRVAAKKSRLPEYPLNAVSGQEHIEALCSALSAFNSNNRKAIDKSGELGDAVTADIYTSIARGLDKQIWFIESHSRRR